MSGAVVVGFTGKIPARGDFVRAGLPRDFTDPWDDWQAAVIAGSRAAMGDVWLEAFLESPVWRFNLPAGVCGPRAVVGLMMPSVDKVGRYFPLSFAALASTGFDADQCAAWLDAVEDLGRRALDDDAPPESLAPPAGPLVSAAFDQSMASWWTDGGPRVEPTRFSLPTLPDAARFASMLGHLAPTESAT